MYKKGTFDLTDYIGRENSLLETVRIREITDKDTTSEFLMH